MNVSLHMLKTGISWQAFLRGLGIGAGIYGVLVLAALLTPPNGPSYKKDPQVFPVMRAEIASADHPPGVETALHEETEGPHEPPAPALAGKEGLVEEVGQGQVPRKSSDGLTPFDTYKREYKYEGMPVVALAVVDYGLSEQDSAAALDKLPAEVSLVVNPYAPNIAAWQDKAEAQKRELWLYVPSETASFPLSDPGPEALLARFDSQQNKERLYSVLARTHNYAGIAMNNDVTLLSARLSIEKNLQDIFSRGLGYLELNPAAPNFFEMTALVGNAPYVHGEKIIGAGGDDKTLLAELETEARQSGMAAGIVQLSPNSLETINEWARGLKGRGIALAPVSALAQDKLTSSAEPKKP